MLAPARTDPQVTEPRGVGEGAGANAGHAAAPEAASGGGSPQEAQPGLATTPAEPATSSTSPTAVLDGAPATEPA
jgi:hypothetical protein